MSSAEDRVSSARCKVSSAEDTVSIAGCNVSSAACRVSSVPCRISNGNDANSDDMLQILKTFVLCKGNDAHDRERVFNMNTCNADH